MNIVDVIKSKPEILKRKLNNNLTEVKDFYSNGQNNAHYFEDENGKLHGEYKWWYDNGTLATHCYYEHGERHGEYKSWYYNGTLCEHCYYEHGERHGEYKWWDNGILLEHCYYEHGELVKVYLEGK